MPDRRAARERDLPDIVEVPLGGLEQHPGRVPKAHLFAGSQSTWYEISDDLPQFDAWPGDEAAVRRTD